MLTGSHFREEQIFFPSTNMAPSSFNQQKTAISICSDVAVRLGFHTSGLAGTKSYAFLAQGEVCGEKRGQHDGVRAVNFTKQPLQGLTFVSTCDEVIEIRQI